MKKKDSDEILKREREKLEKLIDEAIERGHLSLQDEAIQRQSRKIDALILKVRKDK